MEDLGLCWWYLIDLGVGKVIFEVWSEIVRLFIYLGL